MVLTNGIMGICQFAQIGEINKMKFSYENLV